MQGVRKAMYWAVIVSETSHVFCCVLPTLFSVLSLLAGLGLASAVPAGLVEIHEILHDWELPIISFSGAVLLIGWAIDLQARRIDCHDTGCIHEPCGTRKRRAHKVLKIATVLFLANVFVFLVFHRGMDIMVGGAETHAHVHAESSAH